MKKFGAATFLLMTTVLMLWGEGITYRRIADLYDHGRIGELHILADLGTTREGGRLVSIVHHYDSTLAGVPVRLRLFHALKPGLRYPVYYFPQKLQDYASANSGAFSAYVIGRKSDSKWDIFLREVGRSAFWILAGFEALWVLVAVRLLCRTNAPVP